MADEIDIYITVTRNNADSWKPVKAVHRGEDVYEIVGSNTSPAGETWRYSTGDFVRCKPYDLTDNDVVLVAWEKTDKPGPAGG
ncbi:MAG TPA: hypothetical protein VFE84_14175 [Patescibacteria group bacterium]|nr:hypothetical protein [Patescibacteria group bacterium]